MLNPPINALAANARLAITSTPRRLHLSASNPDGNSKIGTTAA